MKNWIKALNTALLICIITTPTAAFSKSLTERQDVRDFINQLVKQHKFDRQSLNVLFNQTKLHQNIIDATTRPAESKPWHKYRPIFVTKSRAQEGVQFMRGNQKVLAQAEKKYGVPAEIISAIIGVETRYGRYKGKYRVVDALATLGFDYPPRSKFFRKELEEFLLLSREEGFDPLAITGSYAGAMGKPQFISSSYRNYAVDFDGDGIRDLLNNTADAIGSVANYLSRHGWVRGQEITVKTKAPKNYKAAKKTRLKPKTTVQQWQQNGFKPNTKTDGKLKAALIALEQKNGHEYWLGLQNFYAITRYNHSPLYAMAVYQLGQAIKDGQQTMALGQN